MKKLILLFILLLFIPACAKKNTVSDPVQYVTKIADLPNCPRPERLKLEKLIITQHLGSTANVNQIDEIIFTLITYINQLEGTIDCYERRKSAETSTNTLELTGDTRKN